MPDEKQEQPSSETPGWDQAKWLETQPEEVKKLLDGIELTRVQGLKSAAVARKKELAEATKKLKEIESKAMAEKAASETDLVKRGEFERLAAERGAELEALRKARAEHEAVIAAMTEKSSSYEKLIAQMVESRIKSIDPPAYVLDLMSPLSPTDKLAFLDKHEKEFSKGAPNGLPPNNKGSASDKLTPEQIREQTAPFRLK